MFDYTWDADKNDANVRKRGIDFDEAKSVHLDEWCIETQDDLHSDDESRTLTIGVSYRNRCLVVVTSYRDPESPRIISAWRATKRERNEYERRR
ncbi:MAG: BrnT family toxin [Candidatus Limnocylindrales bacterium]